MKQTIAIIHFNTPELTEACILSIRKQGCDWPIVLFDNSADITIPAGTDGNGPKEETIEAHKGETAEEILAQMRGENPKKAGKAQTSAISHQTSPSKPATTNRPKRKRDNYGIIRK